MKILSSLFGIFFALTSTAAQPGQATEAIESFGSNLPARSALDEESFAILDTELVPLSVISSKTGTALCVRNSPNSPFVVLQSRTLESWETLTSGTVSSTGVVIIPLPLDETNTFFRVVFLEDQPSKIQLLAVKALKSITVTDGADTSRFSSQKLQLAGRRRVKLSSVVSKGTPAWKSSGNILGAGITLDWNASSGFSRVDCVLGTETKSLSVEVFSDLVRVIDISRKPEIEKLKNISKSINKAFGKNTFEWNVAGKTEVKYVNQKRSPLVQMNAEVSLSGGGKIKHRYYPPNLSVRVASYVTVGVFFEPELELAAVLEAQRHGVENPVVWRANAGPKLTGRVSAGGEVKFDARKVFNAYVSAELKGTIEASSSFSLQAGSSRMPFNYTLGKLELRGTVAVKYKATTLAEFEVKKGVWNGLKGSASLDLASLL